MDTERLIVILEMDNELLTQIHTAITNSKINSKVVIFKGLSSSFWKFTKENDIDLYIIGNSFVDNKKILRIERDSLLLCFSNDNTDVSFFIGRYIFDVVKEVSDEFIIRVNVLTNISKCIKHLIETYDETKDEPSKAISHEYRKILKQDRIMIEALKENMVHFECPVSNIIS